MERNVFAHILCIVLMCVSFGCSKDDETDPSGTVTLNMLNEESGKTYLGNSDIYINEANNFHTRSCYIADCGNAGGVGKKLDPVTDNLVREVAVAQGHMYQAFDEETIMTFPSRTNAVLLNSTYYRFYVVEPFKSDTAKTGSVVKYVSVQAKADDLPENGKVVAELVSYYLSDPVTIDLPKGAEFAFDKKDAKLFTTSVEGETLKLSLSDDSYPIGNYNLYIRKGSIFTRVVLHVKARS